MSRSGRAAGALLLVVLWGGASGCATYRLAHEASLAEENADWDSAVEHYLQLVERQPSNVRFKTALLRARLKASQEHFGKGQRFRAAGVLERALVEFQEAVQLDSTNQYAQVELDQLRSEMAKADRKGSQLMAAAWFVTDRPVPVLTQGNPSSVNLVLRQASARE